MTTLNTVLGCFYACFFFVFCCSAAEISYSDHCASIVPESIPIGRARYPDFEYTLSDFSTHYYFWGGHVILDALTSNSSDHHHRNLSISEIQVSFQPSYRNVFRTASPGVYKLKASLVFRTQPEFGNYSGPDYDHRSSGNYSSGPRQTSLRFALRGFWSEESKRLCMVGKSKSSHNFESVFEITLGKDSDSKSNATIFTSLVKGSLKSISSYPSSNYFNPVEIVSVPYIKDYNYTLSCLETNDLDMPPKQSLSLKEDSICSTLQYHTYEFDLEYAPECTSPTSGGCSPLKGQPAPSYLSLSAFQCSEDQDKLRYLVSFEDQKYASLRRTTFDPYRTFIGEGTWDSERNHLSIVACNILNPIEDSADVSIGECSFRLSLRFPVVWTIKNTSSIVGLAWSNKTENEFGHFKDIRLSSDSMDNRAARMPGLRFEYTQTEKVREVCPGNQVRKNGDHMTFPKGGLGNSYEMSFGISAKNAKESIAWGDAAPIAVGEDLFGKDSVIAMDSDYGDGEELTTHSSTPIAVGEELFGKNSVITTHSSLMNVSYKLSFSPIKIEDKFFSSVLLSGNHAVDVYAEGVYDSETGHLCMVGCREFHQFNKTEKLLDCEMVMEFQFPALDSKVGSSINGYILSRRKEDDSLYFKPLNISGSPYYSVYAEKAIERMDVEIILILISNTLLCVFVASQILYAKKHSEALQSLSLFMVVVLTLGHMTPLVLNFEALLQKNHDHQQEGFLRQGSKIELNQFGEVGVRLVSLIVFILLLRLLQIKWSARNSSEKKPAFVTFVLYGVGGVFTLLVQRCFSSVSTLKFLKSFGGLVLDGFLLPQIILNLFQNPAHKKSLSCWFYMGTTLIRLFPHAYDFYRERNFIDRAGFYGTSSYIYANPGVDFYSIAWDVVIPCGCVLFSGIIWMQQRYGGRCILPLRIQELLSYEKLPTIIASY